MTVTELIAALQKLEPDLEIMQYNDWNELVRIRKVEVTTTRSKTSFSAFAPKGEGPWQVAVVS